jgi:hypothetical protein
MPKLVYLPKSRRWHAFENMRYCCPLHCGDQIGIRVQDRYRRFRLLLIRIRNGIF